MAPFRKTLWHLGSSRAGRRFQKVHSVESQTRKPWVQVLKLPLGILLIAAGILLLFVPGPGVIVLLVGLGVLASGSRAVARLLDRFELVARNRWQRIVNRWREASCYERIAYAVLLAGIVAVAGFGVLVFFSRFQFVR